MNKQKDNAKYSKGLLSLFFVCILLGYITYSVISVFMYPFSLIYPPAKKALPHLFCKLVKIVFLIQPGCKFKFNINLPKTDRNFLLVANHRSNLDVVAFLAQIPGLRVVANDKLFKVPVFGLLMKLKKQIHVKGSAFDSLNNCLTEMRCGMRKKEPILFFPELTRCNKGAVGTSKFLLTPFNLAISEDALIIPLVVNGTDCVWPKGTVGLNYTSKFESYSLDHLDSRNFKTAKELSEKCKNVINEALLRDEY